MSIQEWGLDEGGSSEVEEKGTVAAAAALLSFLHPGHMPSPHHPIVLVFNCTYFLDSVQAMMNCILFLVSSLPCFVLLVLLL